jgi:hypothetical protein
VSAASGLVQAGAAVDVPDVLGRTPLHVAVRDGRAALVERLITRGADVARRDPHLGRTHEERVPRLRLLRNRDNPGDRVALAGTGK